MGTLDDLVEKDRAYRAKVSACSHDFTGRSLHGDGPCCTKCDVQELPWLRGQVEAFRGALKMTLRSAMPRARDNPTMWDAWGDAAVLLGRDRNAFRVPHADLPDGERALSALRSGRSL